MKTRWPILTIGVIALITIVYASILEWKERHNPYRGDGLVIEWHYEGATSAYPSIHVHAGHEGLAILPDFIFGGIEYPRLRFRDVDGDGRRDIVFENDTLIQAVAFIPASENHPPRFKIIRNDVHWP